MQITFLGAGAFGQVLANIATHNGHTVKYYDPYKYPDTDLRSACANSDALLYAAPSQAAAAILPQLDPKTPLICASKGFLSAQPFARFISFGALGGAGFAADYEKHRSQVGPKLTLTSSLRLTSRIFATDWLTLEQINDTHGILLCGALKNIYAYGAGLLRAEPVNLAEFRRDPAAYAARHQYLRAAASEIKQILTANGAKASTFDHSCGLADLALTCTEESRNFRAGRATAAGQPVEHATIESLHILQNTPDDFQIPAAARLFKCIQEGCHASH